ncbi:MAG: MFS transporter [Chromatiales bacterium]|jgi:MFS family permease|nr:MFS transporter [Chromatiales bacterium]
MSTRFSKDPRNERSLRHSIKDGVAYSVMMGSGESYFSAFAVLLKASTAQVGLLATFPPLLASFAQLLSSWLGRRTGRRKGIIVFGAGLQNLALLPLALLPLLFPAHAVPILIACAVLYHTGANLAAPQWGSLMGDIVPERRRGRYFGRRTRLCSITTFLALIFAGMALEVFDRNAFTVGGFLLIFAVAAIARAVSVYHLARMYDPPGHTAALESPFKGSLLRRLRGSSFARFSLFFAAMQFAVNISGPFFVVYMLRDLGFSYLEFTIMTGTSVLLQFLTLNRWGRLSDAFGNRYILLVTGLLIPFMPALWMFSTNYVYLLLLQAVGGLCWAGFSLSASNYLYDLIPSERRATQLAMHNVGASIGVFCGALLGGYIATHAPKEIFLFGEHYEWFSALYAAFLLSTLARFTVAALFLPRLREMRAVRKPNVSTLIFPTVRFQTPSWMSFDIVGARKSGKSVRDEIERKSSPEGQ